MKNIIDYIKEDVTPEEGIFEIDDIYKFDLQLGDICVTNSGAPFIYLDQQYMSKNLRWTGEFFHVSDDGPYFFKPAKDYSEFSNAATYKNKNVEYYKITHFKPVKIIRDQLLSDIRKIKLYKLLPLIHTVVNKYPEEFSPNYK